MAPDEITRLAAPLFHPRRNPWPDHFSFNNYTGIIEGLTATGRATIIRLRLNSAFQTRARRHWVRLGLYP